MMSKSARQPGFALLRDGPTWRLYRNPEKLLVAKDAEGFKESICRVEEHVKHGGEATAVLRYEAGYALEPRLHPLLATIPGPLAWFGLYANCTLSSSLSSLKGDNDELIEHPRLLIARDKYRSKIAAVRRLIQAGEVYQINFTTRVCFEMKCSAWELFTALFRRHPVPYAAFLNTGTEQIVSFSPELFFQIDRDHIVVRPMKGTAPRGRTLEEDLSRGEELGASEKNRAENVMIVDLMRSDLGRICRLGSVKTRNLFNVERYPSLWQMTSTIEGKLVKGCRMESIVHALFPSGSVTGAPKIRAMEHIAALEDSPRGVYTGAVGFFAPKRARFSVAIRTAELHQKRGEMGVGGGITYDSVAAAEWEECEWKAEFLTRSQPEFKIFETLYWRSKYRFLKAHLVRMRDSAEYFDFRFDERKVRKALRELGVRLSAAPHKVRIALARDGTLEVAHTDLGTVRFGRVRISGQRVSSKDRFLYHKTTNRRVYECELAASRRAKCDDALFLNEKGELTEGTIHNLFVVKSGVWRTPAVTCGLLPGTCRAQILRRRANACEAILTLDELIHADRVYLCNSVRGIFPAEIVWE
jgi:para-aminobenzoate synthetase / 4-amino-4-deoxychorismate lyase